MQSGLVCAQQGQEADQDRASVGVNHLQYYQEQSKAIVKAKNASPQSISGHKEETHLGISIVREKVEIIYT